MKTEHAYGHRERYLTPPPNDNSSNKFKEKYDYYIGRPSICGNPSVIGVDGDRNEVIKKFKVYFYNRLKNDPEFKKEVLKLKDARIGCFCKPLECHGDVIADYLNNGNMA